MYPYIRMAVQLWKNRNAPTIPLNGTHEIETHIMPWDLDIWMELNNGRTLTLLDLGRITFGMRTGIKPLLRSKRYGMTMAGVSVRYRRRIGVFERIRIRSRGVCFDDRFLYIEQAMFKKSGECANHALYRVAVTSRNGIVPTADYIADLVDVSQNEMPEWVAAWIAADAKRPWPPM